jgi:hypothetical protein
LAGYTTLIYEMKEVMDDLTAGKYERKMVKAVAAAAEPQALPKLSMGRQETTFI